MTKTVQEDINPAQQQMVAERRNQKFVLGPTGRLYRRQHCKKSSTPAPIQLELLQIWAWAITNSQVSHQHYMSFII